MLEAPRLSFQALHRDRQIEHIDPIIFMHSMSRLDLSGPVVGWFLLQD